MTFQELLQSFGQLFKWWIVVAPWEQLLRVRLGKKVELLHAGVHMRIPFIDRTFLKTTRKRLVHIPVQTLTTLDGKHVTIAGSIGYSIDNIETMFNTLHQPVDTILQEVMGHVSGYIVTHDLNDCDPDEVSKVVNEKIDIEQYGLNSYGYIVTDFAVVRTYRLLSGDIARWNEDGTLGMDDTEGEN